jgi:hypothetical protein
MAQKITRTEVADWQRFAAPRPTPRDSGERVPRGNQRPRGGTEQQRKFQPNTGTAR